MHGNKERSRSKQRANWYVIRLHAKRPFLPALPAFSSCNCVWFRLLFRNRKRARPKTRPGIPKVRRRPQILTRTRTREEPLGYGKKVTGCSYEFWVRLDCLGSKSCLHPLCLSVFQFLFRHRPFAHAFKIRAVHMDMFVKRVPECFGTELKVHAVQVK
jgi:hypothetical protein